MGGYVGHTIQTLRFKASQLKVKLKGNKFLAVEKEELVESRILLGIL